MHLLQWMETWQENEPISLMTFSSSCRVLRPFGTSHSELRKALYEVLAPHCRPSQRPPGMPPAQPPSRHDGSAVSPAFAAPTRYSKPLLPIPPNVPLQIESEDGARVSQAVRAASSYLQDHCGLDAPGCQIVLVADGDCPFDDVPELEAAAAAFQPSTTVHVVAMGSDAELSR